MREIIVKPKERIETILLEDYLKEEEFNGIFFTLYKSQYIIARRGNGTYNAINLGSGHIRELDPKSLRHVLTKDSPNIDNVFEYNNITELAELIVRFK